MGRIGYAVAALCFGLALWQAVVLVLAPPAFILPSPLRVAHVAWTSKTLLAQHGAVTLIEVLLGLVIGGLSGAFAAIVLAQSPSMTRLAMPLLVLTQAIPVFALAPVLTLWFGYGLPSKVMMAVLIIFFPVLSAFHDGLTRMPPGLLDLAQTMNARRTQEFWRLRIPNAMPSLATGLKLAAVYAPIGAVIGEWVGASRGLGYLMLLANGRAKTDLMFASLLVLACMTIILYRLTEWLADRLAKRWGQG